MLKIENKTIPTSFDVLQLTLLSCELRVPKHPLITFKMNFKIRERGVS